jgi:tRNA-dihydrouridine synthase C
MQVFWLGVSARVAARHRAGRLKQWLNYMRRVYPEAQQAFDELRLVHDAGQVDRWLALHTTPARDLAPAL